MSIPSEDYVAVQPFDREYTLEELLPIDLLDALCRPLPNGPRIRWALCTDTGAPYYATPPWDAHCARVTAAAVAVEAGHRDAGDSQLGDLVCRLFPIDYEFERMGYLAICTDAALTPEIELIARAAVNILVQVMHLKHRTMLTASLHGVVVKDHYEALRHKAQKLARSEEKYKTLAAQLEVEVQRKTTEIRKAHAQLMQQEKMAAIGQLAAGMAHEINNPLGFIQSNLSTLNSYAEDLAQLIALYRQVTHQAENAMASDPVEALAQSVDQVRGREQQLDVQFMLEDITSLTQESIGGAQRIQTIVKDLKTVARPGETEMEQVSVQESIEAVLTVVGNRIGKAIKVHKKFAFSARIHAVAQQISQIWLNLIINALDAMDAGGTLRISIHGTNGMVCVGIGDTGCGIAQNDLNKIYDPFYTTKSVGSGMGLGLHTVYQYVERYGGHIEVTSTLDEGTLFNVFLPISKED